MKMNQVTGHCQRDRDVTNVNGKGLGQERKDGVKVERNMYSGAKAN